MTAIYTPISLTNNYFNARFKEHHLLGNFFHSRFDAILLGTIHEFYYSLFTNELMFLLILRI